jgi:hypothetical protein
MIIALELQHTYSISTSGIFDQTVIQNGLNELSQGPKMPKGWLERYTRMVRQRVMDVVT